MVGLEEAIWGSVAFGKGANFLKGNDIKVNSLIDSTSAIWASNVPSCDLQDMGLRGWQSLVLSLRSMHLVAGEASGSFLVDVC